MSGLQISILFLSISLILLVFFIALIVLTKATAGQRIMTKRLERFETKHKSALAGFKEVKTSKKRSRKSKNSLEKSKLMDALFNELVLASIIMRPEEFMVLWLVLVFVPSGLVALFTANFIPSITLAVLGAIAPILVIQQRKKKRVRLFDAQLSDALIIVCNCLRSGLSFQQAMETIAKEMPAPIGQEFARAVNEIKYGNNLETALNNMSARIDSSDLMLAVSAVNIQRQTGGNLSQILETISVTIRDRIKIKSDIRSMTAQGRISGLVIGFLPIGLGAILLLISPDYMTMFFTETAGKIMLVVAVVMETLGFLLIKKITTIKY